MNANREADVTRAFVSIAASLATGHDVVEMLAGLTEDCARLLNVESVGLLLADGLGELHVMAASSERTRQLELFQLQRADGPCLDCFRKGSPVSVGDLEAFVDKWPHFVPQAREYGFASVHALPLRLRDNVLGAMGLFGTSVGELPEPDLALGQALADVASIALIQDTASADTASVIEQLQSALDSRVLIEQAKGFLAQRGNIDAAEAFSVLRTYARDHNQRLSEVAQAVMDRSIAAATLLDHVERRTPK